MENMENITSRQERMGIEEVGGGSVIEGIGGIGALVLAIVGLLGVAPMMLASIATIAAGGALLVGGGAIAARYSRVLAGTQMSYNHEIIGGGMAMESLCGVAGIVLGVLGLIGLAPLTLLSAAVIVFGAALLMASASIARLSSLPIRREFESAREHYIARDALYAASGSDVLVGAGAVVLGILALSGHAPLTLVLVALICVGASEMLSGTSVAGRVFGSMAFR